MVSLLRSLFGHYFPKTKDRPRIQVKKLSLHTLLCSVSEHGRTMPGTVKGKKIMKVYISDGRSEPLVGKCVFILREKREEVNTNNFMVSD